MEWWYSLVEFAGLRLSLPLDEWVDAAVSWVSWPHAKQRKQREEDKPMQLRQLALHSTILAEDHCCCLMRLCHVVVGVATVLLVVVLEYLC